MVLDRRNELPDGVVDGPDTVHNQNYGREAIQDEVESTKTRYSHVVMTLVVSVRDCNVAMRGKSGRSVMAESPPSVVSRYTAAIPQPKDTIHLGAQSLSSTEGLPVSAMNMIIGQMTIIHRLSYIIQHL